MHNRILVLEDETLSADDFLICFPWFLGTVADYVMDLGVSVEDDLQCMLEEPGISINASEKTISFSDSDSYFEKILESYNRISKKAMITRKIEKDIPASEAWGEILTRARMAIDVLDDKFGIYIVFEGELFTLNEFFHYIKVPATFKVTHILDYHF